jgi:hypothetical protein
VAPLEKLHLIIVSDPPSSLREAIQEVVVQHSPEWWHQLPDVWIVEGGTALEWRNRLTPLKTAAGATGVTILVFHLPDLNDRDWAAHGPPPNFEWLHGNYTAAPAPAAADDDIPF